MINMYVFKYLSSKITKNLNEQGEESHTVLD